jgi:bifunctional non-homologous end joining protein LigD
MEVEDHAIEYGSFEGEIPESEYGAGKVVIWDSGQYSLEERGPKKLRFNLHGKKLRGNYDLILWKQEHGRAQWLIFKEREETAFSH